ncbi:MAG: 50S ribosomal protein L4 [Nitrospirae bacterium]|jgi:large subunit ribosomal protein L4|nr:MAG: 50S ribosomal protein L4 [Nitrospirae bacterium 13_2_20CM_2_62_8]OLD36111.1 MAG: 50S ribosomal protein L4 [Nitrospirae bacterium 13_1_40CM_2_62_10]OLD75338.1 MAG: 50S ribosomal protein L4 [Nitrospirae bacterium 13_1_20CM_4_62_6]TLY44555.1 MAG: 50S ribosomal protein L4 [Nitrospirota bacterium]
MPTVDVLDIHKRKVGSVELHDGVFGVEADGPLVHTAVVMQQACARQGTASTLTRGEVSGSGRKPWKQKHTGRARAGSIRSPIWRHGGRVFGPRPRSYAYSLPKKKYRAALQSALSAKLAAGGIVVVSALTLEEPKTRRLAKVLAQMGLTGKTLIVIGEGRTDLERAARNLREVKLIKPEELNVYDVLRHDSIVIPERELLRVQEVWS